MVATPMYEKLTIRSIFHTYTVEVIEGGYQDILREFGLEKNESGNSFFIIDKTIYEMYKPFIEDSLQHIFVLEAHEKNKTYDSCYKIIEYLISNGAKRNSTIVAWGGGVVQDVASFVASVYYRGIQWVFYPTTLLAQADSCIGSKISINFQNFKNLLGGFYPPKWIYCYSQFLETLPEVEIKSGIGEILHYYFIANSLLLTKIVKNYNNLLSNPLMLPEYIAESLKIKKDMVEMDEFDRGPRNIFNYGHTFGHALEAVSGFNINHGQAVTAGMDLANYISMKKGFLTKENFHQLHLLLENNLPDLNLSKDQIKVYMDALSKDKKNISSQLTCILTRGLGRMFKTEIPMDNHLLDWLEEYFLHHESK
jgi:3-dehydroquinate synthase